MIAARSFASTAALTTPVKIAAEYQAAPFKGVAMTKTFADGIRPGVHVPGPPDQDADAPAHYLYEGTLRTFSSNDDVIDTLGAGSDVIYGGRGNDRIWGGGGADYLFGGAGDDEIFGGTRGDVAMDKVGDSLFGGAGNDRIIAGSGNDFIYAGSNTGNFNGTNQATATYDEVQGNGGNDMIYLDGWNGGQALGGAGGTYYADGGTGNDTFIVGDIVYAQIMGGHDNDTYTGRDTDSYIFNAFFHGKADIQGFQDHETITLDDYLTGHEQGDTGVVLSLAGGGSITVEGCNWAQIEDNLRFI
jgi:hypothetical protein